MAAVLPGGSALQREHQHCSEVTPTAAASALMWDSEVTPTAAAPALMWDSEVTPTAAAPALMWDSQGSASAELACAYTVRNH